MGLLLMTLQDPLKCLEEGPLVLVLWVFLLLALAPPSHRDREGGHIREGLSSRCRFMRQRVFLAKVNFGDLVRRRRHCKEPDAP